MNNSLSACEDGEDDTAAFGAWLWAQSAPASSLSDRRLNGWVARVTAGWRSLKRSRFDSGYDSHTHTLKGFRIRLSSPAVGFFRCTWWILHCQRGILPAWMSAQFCWQSDSPRFVHTTRCYSSRIVTRTEAEVCDFLTRVNRSQLFVFTLVHLFWSKTRHQDIADNGWMRLL